MLRKDQHVHRRAVWKSLSVYLGEEGGMRRKSERGQRRTSTGLSAREGQAQACVLEINIRVSSDSS